MVYLILRYNLPISILVHESQNKVKMPATCFCLLKSFFGKDLEQGCNIMIVVRLVCWVLGFILAYLFGDSKKVYDVDISLVTRFNYVEVLSGHSSVTGTDGKTTETKWILLTEKSGASGNFWP